MITFIESSDCEYDIRCDLPMEFFVTVEGKSGLGEEEVLRLVSKEHLYAAVETIIGGQSNSDLLQRCIKAWKNHDCIKTIM